MKEDMRTGTASRQVSGQPPSRPQAVLFCATFLLDFTDFTAPPLPPTAYCMHTALFGRRLSRRS
eukprot:2956191-Rhodomonas_salina.1